MFEFNDILNERDARRAKVTLEKAREIATPAASLEATRSGLSPLIADKHRRAISGIVTELAGALERYDAARAGDFAALMERYRGDPGIALVIARIARGLSQGALAEKLGLREQQIQRYEAERYRTIGLANYRKIASLLGVDLRASIMGSPAPQFAAVDPTLQPDLKTIKRVVEHARSNWWTDRNVSSDSIVEFTKESISKLGQPALLRTGLTPNNIAQDFLLAAWRARVIERAESEAAKGASTFNVLDIGWISDLTRLSVRNDGALLASRLLSEKGIVFIYEPAIQGLHLDGAAMLISGHPVIAMTLRHDRIDNFWFTLLHELAHIYLHFRMGLSVGFYDDLEAVESDEIESEADEFASEALVPNMLWRTSAARIAKDPAPIEKFAEQLGIHPAIVFGRVRMERKNYSIFSEKVGLGRVRSQFVKEA